MKNEVGEKTVNTLQDIFGINNSKHNSIGYINGLCSEHLRLEIQEQMKNSLTLRAIRVINFYL